MGEKWGKRMVKYWEGIVLENVGYLQRGANSDDEQ
jgi:hypothetical protein